MVFDLRFGCRCDFLHSLFRLGERKLPNLSGGDSSDEVSPQFRLRQRLNERVNFLASVVEVRRDPQPVCPRGSDDVLGMKQAV